MSRGLRKLVGILTVVLAGLWWRPAVLLPGLAALPSSGCMCDCVPPYMSAFSATPMSSLEVSGGACGEPTCEWAPPETGGGCRSYQLALLKVGTCHLSATATDGRTATRDVPITVLKHNCCGDIYTTGISEASGQPETVALTF